MAQPPGSELVDAVAADAAGDEAYVTIASVEAFPVDGGEAIFEPGSPYEETFTYATVDAESNRLVGLTRSAPMAHSAGAFVQPPESPTSPAPVVSPSSSPSPTPSGEDGGEPEGDAAGTTAPDTEGANGASGASANGEAISFGDASAPSSEGPDPCIGITGNTCVGTVIDVVALLCGDALCGLGDPCGAAGLDCETGDPCTLQATAEACQVVEDLLNGSNPDPCMLVEGRTCSQVIGELCPTGALECLGETVPTAGLWIDPPMIIPLVEVTEDGSLHPCSVSPEIDEISYNHGFLATNVDVHGDSHIASDCRTLVEDLHAQVRITTTSRTQLLSPLGSSSSSDSCDSETPGTCNTDLLHQYPAADAVPSTISWRFYFSWEVPSHDNFIFEIERCYRAVYWGPIASIPCFPGGPTE